MWRGCLFLPNPLLLGVLSYLQDLRVTDLVSLLPQVADVAVVEVDGNLKSLQTLIGQARKLDKAAYLFSVDEEGGKVVHINYLPRGEIRAGFDARTWANAVAEVVGGRVSNLF